MAAVATRNNRWPVALAAVIALTWFLARHRSTSAAPATPAA